MSYFGISSTQAILFSTVWGLLLMPVLGFLGAVFLNWSQLLLESRPIRYWTAYKVTTLGSMAVVVFLVPVELITNHLGGLGFVIYVALSIVALALIYSRWLNGENAEPIGIENAFWLSMLQSGLWLLVVGVFFGLGMAVVPKQTFFGVALAIVCAALLVGVATISLRRPVAPSAVQPANITWKTDDILGLYRHATDEFERGERDDELWALATIARPDPGQRREWYLGERVKKLKKIAEEQLRREGFL
jgi:hypothetical protein